MNGFDLAQKTILNVLRKTACQAKIEELIKR